MISLFRLAIRGVTALYLFSLCACSTLPHFSSVAVKPLGPHVSDIVAEIQGEAAAAVKANGLAVGDEYAVSVNLTLDVTNNQGVNPNLSYLDPLKTANTTFASPFTAQWSGQQHRNFTLAFTFLMDATASAPTGPQASGLSGNLGISEVVGSGLPYLTGKSAAGQGSPYFLPVFGVDPKLNSVTDPLPGQDALVPSFGATIDFTIIYGAGVSPLWTLIHFAGPGSTSGTLANWMRTNKDTLIIAFAKVPATNGGESPAQPEPENSPKKTRNRRLAARAAEDYVTQMLLQRLIVQ